MLAGGDILARAMLDSSGKTATHRLQVTCCDDWLCVGTGPLSPSNAQSCEGGYRPLSGQCVLVQVVIYGDPVYLVYGACCLLVSKLVSLFAPAPICDGTT